MKYPEAEIGAYFAVYPAFMHGPPIMAGIHYRRNESGIIFIQAI